MKDKYLMVISIDEKKAFDKIQHIFIIKTLSKVGNRVNIYINIIKAKCGKPTANIILNRQNLQAFPVRLGTNGDVCFHHSYSTQYWKSYSQQLDKKKK